jgi:hypothetical protein
LPITAAYAGPLVRSEFRLPLAHWHCVQLVDGIGGMPLAFRHGVIQRLLVALSVCGPQHADCQIMCSVLSDIKG